ncbi:MAG: PilX N-terminal domain-containing pilus assembly protein [Burkholderiaceae bacterium]
MRMPYKEFRGTVLIVALVMLVLLTLLAATGARIALTDEKGARASRERVIAFEAAEAGLRDAEDEMLTGVRAARFAAGSAGGFEAGCPAVALPTAMALTASTRGLCLPAAAGQMPVWRSVSLAARGVPYGTFTGQRWSVPGTAPRYLIEVLPDYVAGAAVGGAQRPQRGSVLYRVTAEGLSASGEHVAAVQSAFRP